MPDAFVGAQTCASLSSARIAELGKRNWLRGTATMRLEFHLARSGARSRNSAAPSVESVR